MKKILLIGSLIAASFTNAQNVNIPDANFKAYLVGNTAINTNLDTEIQVTEANTYTGNIYCANLNISDLTGIEEFTSINQLGCNNNPLTTLDLTQNTTLTFLDCSNNQLTSLDVTQNTALTYLSCYSNSLTSLDITQNSNLFTLNCYSNQLTSLDVTQNSNLANLDCYSNQLTSLDVTQNSNLANLDCFDNLLAALDVSQNSALVNLNCSVNQLTCLSVNNGQNVNLDCSFNTNLFCATVFDFSWTYQNATYDNGIIFDETDCLFLNINNDIIQNGATLTAELLDASYQWLNCNDNYSVINGETNQSFTPITTGYFAVELTIINGCGEMYVDTSSCHLVDYTSVVELSKPSKELIKIVDLTGRETEYKPNIPLIFIYSDGTRERVMKIEE